MPGKQSFSLIDNIIAKLNRKASTNNEAELSDLSYEDALLDVEIRSFMRSEYGRQEPPAGVFSKVLRAIRLHKSDEEMRASASQSALRRAFNALQQTMSTAYRTASRAETSRLISGSLVTALLLMAVWPSISRSLNGELPGKSLYIPAATNQLRGADSTKVNVSGPAESPTGISGPSDAPGSPSSASSGSTVASAPETNFISPGRIYEDRVLAIAEKTGEDPEDLTTPNNWIDRNWDQSEYNRPVSGEY